MTPQPTPAPHQHEPAPFTTGKAKHSRFGTISVSGVPIAVVHDLKSAEECRANAALTAACFNSCTALWKAGYNHQKVIEALPEIMKFLETAAWREDYTSTTESIRLQERIRQLRRTKGTQ